TTPGAQTINATYTRPYQMHASLGPSAAVAHYQDGKLTLWVHTQGVFPIRRAVADALGMAEEDVHVIHRDGAGCYGHNGADDAALDAALLARARPGQPVALKWMRADEHAWEPYAPPMRLDLQATLSPAGEVLEWHHHVYSPSHFGRPRNGNGLLAARFLARPLTPPAPQPALGSH